jgi:hypothetical protein
MDPVMADVDIIRAVRRLCLQHKFDDACYLAQTIEDPHSRRTLLVICNSFRQAQIKPQIKQHMNAA